MSKQFITIILISMQSAAGSPYNDPTLSGILASWAAPLRCTKQGVKRFFNEVFNTRLYAEHFLPCSFMHLADFLRYAGNLEKNKQFTHETLSLFYTRLKEAPYVNPYALHEFIDQLPTLYVKEKLNNQELIETILIHLETLVFDASYGTQIDADALRIHATTIVDHVHTHNRLEKAIHDRLFQLLELAFNKLIFDPREDYATWIITREIAKTIIECSDYGTITKGEQDDLLWSLTARYAYFLTLSGGELTADTLTLIKTELCDSGCTLIAESSTDSPFLPTRRKILTEALEEAFVKTTARSHGIVTNSLLQ